MQKKVVVIGGTNDGCIVNYDGEVRGDGETYIDLPVRMERRFPGSTLDRERYRILQFTFMRSGESLPDDILFATTERTRFGLMSKIVDRYTRMAEVLDLDQKIFTGQPPWSRGYKKEKVE